MKKKYILITFLITNFIYGEAAFANQNKLIIYTYDSFVSDWGPGPIIEEEFEKIQAEKEKEMEEMYGSGMIRRERR